MKQIFLLDYLSMKKMIYATTIYFCLMLLLNWFAFSELFSNYSNRNIHLCGFILNGIWIIYIVFMLRPFGVIIQWGIFCIYNLVLLGLGLIMFYLCTDTQILSESYCFIWFYGPLFWVLEGILVIYSKISKKTVINKSFQINRSFKVYTFIVSLLIVAIFITILIMGILASAEDYE